MKTAIVGCGAIAQVHGQALSQMGEETTLTAAADILPERAQKLTAAFGGTAYASLEEMLDNEELDVLHVCTPHALHTPMVQLAAEKGIAVFSEKPPVTTQEQWQTLSALEAKIPIGVCFQNRYNKNVQYIRQLIASGKTGRLTCARAFVTWSRNAAYYTESGWRGSLLTEGGGALINQAIHTMDLLVYLLGTPQNAEAGISNHHLKGVIEVEDTMEAYWKVGDAPVLFYATTAYGTDAPVLMDISFEHVQLRMEDNRITCLWSNGQREEITFAQGDAKGKLYWGSGHETCIRDFYKSLQTGTPVPIGIKEITDTVSLMLAVYRSAREAGSR